LSPTATHYSAPGALRSDLPRSARVLGVRAPGQPVLFDAELPPLREGTCLVETLFSGVSAGTELTYLKGTNPMLRARFDRDLGVFRSDQPAEGYPVEKLGYMEVGRVIASRARSMNEGQVVAMAYGHRSHHLADPMAERIVPLPDALDPLLGIYVAHMGPICANGLLHAATEVAGRDVRRLGDGVAGLTVVVVGGGVVGLLTALLAAHHGAAEVAVVDRTPARLAAARAFGLHAIDEDEDEAWRWVKESWRHAPGDRGADVVFQCRGQDWALAEALRCLRPQGVVIDLAFYPGGAPELRLGEEFHHNGLAIRCAQIGRVPRGLAHLWDRDRLSRETIEVLLAHGPALRKHLITDVVAAQDGPQLLRDLAERRRHAIQAVLAYPPADR
jgi:threonine dehydrogenase-like Zn-dependent dehydrogenase